jgi:hypothetical protein
MLRILSFLLMLMCSCAMAAGPDWCPEKSCSVAQYKTISKKEPGTGTPDPGCTAGYSAACVSASLAPSAGGPVYIECVRTSTFTHTCNAWVKGPQLQYYWSPNGPFALYQTGSGGDEVELVCWYGDVGAGTIAVSIGSPFGLHSSTTLTIDCGQNIFQ